MGKSRKDGKHGFAIGVGKRANGTWKKERTPRGRLEILLNDVSYEQLKDLFRRLDNDEFDGTARVGDVLDIAVLKEIFVRNTPGEKIKVSSDRLLKLYDFIYGKKSENNVNGKVNVDIDAKMTSVKGFILPVSGQDFIDDKGRQIEQGDVKPSKDAGKQQG